MNQFVTGAIIRELRERRGLTQAQLAEKLNVSDKTVSKWETGKGYPDIALLEPIARTFDVSVAELLSGSAILNRNPSGNMLRSRFYVCPVCGNVLHGMGEAAIHCHGVLLTPWDAEPPEEGHRAAIDVIEDEYYVHFDHPMTKAHYISFIAALSPDGLQLAKLYPEGSAEARFKMRGVRRVVWYCNRDGLFGEDVKGLPKHAVCDTIRPSQKDQEMMPRECGGIAQRDEIPEKVE